jgi:UTP--glucose-1-phosphate uridylyltransferase
MHIRQGVANGLGHAVLCARPIIGDAPFAVVLPDVIIDDAASNPKKDNLADMVAKFNTSRVSQVMVEQVADEDVSKFGIADLDGASIEPGQSAKIHKMVEKPPLDEAPSNLAVVGRYVLSEKIWDLLEFTPPGAGGEIQLTDAIDALMNLEQVDAYYMKGKSHDCGSKLGYMKANVEYALRHPALGEEFKEYLATVLK